MIIDVVIDKQERELESKRVKRFNNNQVYGRKLLFLLGNSCVGGLFDIVNIVGRDYNNWRNNCNGGY